MTTQQPQEWTCTGLNPEETDWFAALGDAAQCEPDEIEKARTEAEIHVWRQDGAPAGFAALFWRDDHVEVNILGVDPAFRRRGVATRILHEVREMAKARGLPRVRLYTTNDNTGALRLYQRIGFRLVAVSLGEIERTLSYRRIGHDGIPVRDLFELSWDVE
jgi:ribosomal protein S18 acetylase RimI-like enzyme